MNPLTTHRVDIEREPTPRIMWDWSNTTNYSKHRTARIKRAKAKKKAKK